ncbi:MAG: prolyl oligopeptidase family serine peptidase [Kofleriaceae bacterium]
MEADVVPQGRVVALALLAACGAQPASATQLARTTSALAGATYDLGALHVTGAPRPDPAIGAQLAAYGAIGSSRLLDISDDGKRLLIAHGGDAMVVSAPLAKAVVVEANAVDVAWAAFGEHGAIDVAGDRDGTEDDRLYETSNGSVRTLVAERRIADPIERRGRLVWAEPDADATAIWLFDGTTPRKVFTGDGGWAVIDLSADGTQLLARKTVSLDSSTLYRIDAHDGHAVALTSVDPRVAAPGAQFGANGELFAIGSAGDALNVWELMTRGQRLLAPELAWDVTQLAVAADGGTVAFTANEDGASVLYLYDTITHAHHVAANAPTGGVITELRFAAASPVLAFSFSDPHHPRDVFTYDVATAALAQWTRADLGSVSGLVTPEHVHIPGELTVPALVMRPAHPARAPVLLELHGGPEDQWLSRWAPFEQSLVARGFAIVQPNVRGSVGYGRTFAAADDGVHREDPVRDVGAVLAWIATQPDLDATRVSVMGTSYGGYLALASLIAYPDQLHAGIDVVGIADFVAFLEGTAPYRRASRRAEYGDERDAATRARLAKLSPLARASSIKAPLLVAQGRRDPRVPAAVADRLVATVRGAGGTVWYLSAADEGHGFTKPGNLVALQTLIVQLISSP